MLLTEIFGRKKVPAMTPDEKAELEQQRRGDLRQLSKPAPGQTDTKLAGDADISTPEALSYTDFLNWFKSMQEKQGILDSEGPRRGDVVMTRHGPAVVVDPNGGGTMVASVKTSDGRNANVNWMKLSRPVRVNHKQYYVYGV